MIYALEYVTRWVVYIEHESHSAAEAYAAMAEQMANRHPQPGKTTTVRVLDALPEICPACQRVRATQLDWDMWVATIADTLELRAARLAKCWAKTGCRGTVSVTLKDTP